MLGRTRRQALFVLALAAGGILGAGCGGSPPSGVANLRSTTTTLASTPQRSDGGGTAAKYKAALAYVDCMRSHGESSFPDPTSNGEINVDFAYGGKDGSPASSGIDRMSPQYISADQACRHLLPGGVPTAAQNEQDLAKELRYASCMRTHGVPNFPDPTRAGVVQIIGVDQNAPQYQRAQQTCTALVPGANSK